MSLPAPTHSMFISYYTDINYSGDYRGEVKNTETLYFNWAYFMSGNAQLNDAFQTYQGDGKHFIFGPNTNPTDTTVTALALASLDTAAPYWDLVDYVYFDEMSSLDKTGLQNFIIDWHAAETARGLANKPVIVNFPMITAPGSWEANNIDVVGMDCYMDPSQQNSGSLVTDLEALITTALVFTSPRNVLFTVQAYNRHGAWTNITSLRDIQTVPYTMGYNQSHVLGLLLFSYGQNSGTSLDTRGLPQCIRTEHIRMWAAITSGTQPSQISCSSQSVTPNWYQVTLTCGTFCKVLTCAIPNTLSGIYKLVPGLKHDTLYATIFSSSSYTTIDQPIPTPFGQTALVPSSDS